MAGKFEIRSGKTGKFCFNVVSSIKTNAQSNKRFERKTAEDGSSYFVIKAAHGESIGKSEMYETTKAMENGIASVGNHAPVAPVADGDIKPITKSASV